MKLIKRKEVFEKHKNILSWINCFQKACFDEEYDEINNEMFDVLRFETKQIKNNSFILSFNHNKINSFSEELAQKLILLFEFLNVKELILMSHLKVNFFGNIEHDNENVINSYSELKKITLTQSYSEAIVVTIAELPKLIEIFFYLQKCDASSPEYIFWFDINENFCFHLCQYGNIHFTDFTNGQLISERQCLDLQMKIIKGQCSEK